MRTVRCTFFNDVPKADGDGTDSPLISSATSPSARPDRSGVCRLVPTIISAMSRAVVSAGTQVPTFWPSRKIVAVSHSLRISSSL